MIGFILKIMLRASEKQNIRDYHHVSQLPKSLIGCTK